jgi:hypothetical protein
VLLFLSRRVSRLLRFHLSRVCSCDANTDFDPIDLDMHVTPANVAAAMSEGDHMQALLLALRLNERPLLQRVYESVPVERIAVMAANLPRAYVSNMCERHSATLPHRMRLYFVVTRAPQAGGHRSASRCYPPHRVPPPLGNRDSTEPRRLAAGS